MQTRKEIQEQKTAAKKELLKICRAIIIDQASRYNGGDNPYFTRINLKIDGSKSKEAYYHLAMNTDTINNLCIRKATGKQLALLDAFLKKHDYDSKSLFKKGEAIRLCLKRIPSEEEINWSECVFKEAGIDKDFGGKEVTFSFTADVRLNLKACDEKSLENSINILTERVKKLNNTLLQAHISYKEGNIQVVKTSVVDGLHRLKWWFPTPEELKTLEQI